ncbi:hypothetical protein TNCV_4146901 [Trichonephila clavipes]|nr:hypothetical protein TNCV_4146901 [Trichonephila clavipes]
MNVEDDILFKTPDYIAADNVRDEYPLSEFRIDENCSAGIECCEQSRHNSFSKTIDFGTECFEVTTVVLRLPKLDTTAIGIWSDESSFTLFLPTGRMFVCRTQSEAFHFDCLVPIMKHVGVSVRVISSQGLGSFVVLRRRITNNHYLALTLCFRLSFRESSLCSKVSVLSVFKHEHEYEVKHLTGYLQSPDLNII